MIGVCARDEERHVVAEFFQLFKTPWEFYRTGAPYDVVICSGAPVESVSALLILVYGSENTPFDGNVAGKFGSHSNVLLSHLGSPIPIYGSCLSFDGQTGPLHFADRPQSASVEIQSGAQTIIRLGYDLFQEIEHLLTNGQPATFAQFSTLDLHIHCLRNLIVSHGIPLVEIPPVPGGYRFIVCLTHDVDHFGIRNHCFDHTIWGFLGRALFGSVIDFLRGKRSARQVATNWLAALSLPAVYLGIRRDFWEQLDKYVEVEKELKSTFFILPESGNPGAGARDRESKKRSAKYELAQLRHQLRTLQQAGREIGVHGIDAWLDDRKGRNELERIRAETGAPDVGVRMHWLYFSKRSPELLEKAGFSYDSTIGYNETVGYRAGTTQAFKHLNASRLMELPMHIMDTALFYPSYMNLSPNKRSSAVNELVKNSERLGGVLTVNWHDRSIAPERLWDGFYVGLLDDLRKRAAWFATAGDVVAWFRKRRETVFEHVSIKNGTARIQVPADPPGRDLPALDLRVHRPSPPSAAKAIGGSSESRVLDFTLKNSGSVEVAI